MADGKYTYLSPLGAMELVCDRTALTGLRFTDGEPRLSGTASAGPARRPLPPEVARWLDMYFSGHEPGYHLALAPQGTPFQLRVWHELLKIPYGQTVTYGELARRVGCRSAQAVGQAVGRNPIAIIIPCHRVVGAGGCLTGYAYGLEKKALLLALEN